MAQIMGAEIENKPGTAVHSRAGIETVDPQDVKHKIKIRR